MPWWIYEFLSLKLKIFAEPVDHRYPRITSSDNVRHPCQFNKTLQTSRCQHHLESQGKSAYNATGRISLTLICLAVLIVLIVSTLVVRWQNPQVASDEFT
jgi:hypothetical protein